MSIFNRLISSRSSNSDEYLLYYNNDLPTRIDSNNNKGKKYWFNSDSDSTHPSKSKKRKRTKSQNDPLDLNNYTLECTAYFDSSRSTN